MELFLKFPGVDGRIILRCILKNWDGEWTGLIRLRIGTGRGAVVNAVMKDVFP